METIHNDDTLVCVFGLIIMLWGTLVVLGTAWGLHNKVVVYNGTLDLLMSFALPVLIPLAIINIGMSDLAAWILRTLTVCLVAYSVKKSLAANSSGWKTMVVIPTKLTLTVLIVFCGLMAVGGLLEAGKATRKNDYKEAGKYMALSAVASFGFVGLRKLIAKLLKPAYPI